MAVTQANRMIAVSSPLGPDVLLFRRMTGTEQLGRLFEFQLDMLSENAEISLDDVLGQPLEVTLDLGDGSKRYFHGLAVSFAQLTDEENYAAYRATVRPWLWCLTRTADCRIFQEMTVPDIIKQVFQEAGFTDFEDRCTGSYRTWEYSVQYRETDFNFVSRLMEQEGIYYYFEHAAGKHTLILADGYSSHAVIPGCATVPYFPPQPGVRRERDHLHEWVLSRQVEAGTYVLDDFDFERPSTDLLVKSTITRSHAQAGAELYDYPGQYVQTGDGTNYVTARIQEWQAQYEQVHARGNVRGLYTGGLFSMDKFPRADQNREYLITGATYELTSDVYRPEASAAPRELYSLGLTAIPSQTPYRVPRLTPKPVVQGPQTALVVGKAGEEIWTDKYGRVKVQFHWDRLGTSDENSSCWVRVAQLWAGKTWGGIHIPRIGQEVIVEFLEGDPDRPIITGRVYNAEQMPPYTLPDNMTQSGIKSRSTKTGTADNFNELRFEDKKDEEQVYFHAEKNCDRVVENNDTLKVGFQAEDKKNPGDPKGSQTVEIWNNQKLVVGCAQSPDGSQTIEIWKNRTTTIQEGNETLTISKGNRAETITKGNDSLTISEGNREATISKGGDTLTISQGDQTITISAGKQTTTAGTSIELKVGNSSIKIEAAKITIAAPEIAIQGTAKVDVESKMTTVKGTANLILDGGLVKIK